MSISAIQSYHDQLKSYKPTGFVPDTADAANAPGGIPGVRPLTATELAGIDEGNPAYASEAISDAPGFGDMVKGFLKNTNDKLTTADEKTRQLMTGKTHDTGAVVSSVEEADLALQFAIAFRSKFVSAFQNISQMQF